MSESTKHSGLDPNWKQPMITINGGPYVYMDHLLTDEDARSLDEEITFGLARTDNTILSVGREFSRGDAAPEFYNHDYKDVQHAEAELTPAERTKLRLAGFKYKEYHKYLKYAKGAYHPWSHAYMVMNSEWVNQQTSNGKVITEEANRLFPKLIKWCYDLPIFKEIGRISIFGVDVNQHITVHRDFDPRKLKDDHHLLMVSPRGAKKSFTFDQENNKKYYVDSKCYIFHDLNFHGVDPSPHWTYNFRIDGTYTDEFLATLEYNRPWEN